MKNLKIHKVLTAVITLISTLVFTRVEVFAKSLKPITTLLSGKTILLKFGIAMCGVLFSVVLIFIGLKLYKKLIFKNNNNIEAVDYDKILETPKDFKEAINSFLHKTDK